jgi:DNA polymerase iota
MDDHDIGKVPNIGFKMAAKLREYTVQHLPKSSQSGENEAEEKPITVHDVRTMPGMNSLLLDKILSGPGMPRDVGTKVWALLHGVDDTEVGAAREIPRQISIEDSYGSLDTLFEVQKQLVMLSSSLIYRMRIDLTEEDEEPSEQKDQQEPNTDTTVDKRRWIAHAKTLRLSTRPRPPRNPDGTRSRTFNRISRSTQVPSFLYDLSADIEILADKLVVEHLMPLFRRLHPEKSGWDLSLLNVAVTNLAETGSSGKLASGRDILKMFKNQDRHLSAWRVIDEDVAPDMSPTTGAIEDTVMSNAAELHTRYDGIGSEDTMPLSQPSQSSQLQATWDDEQDDTNQTLSSTCPSCGATMPYFAMPAHLRFHESED